MSNLSDGALGALARGKTAAWVADAYDYSHFHVVRAASHHGLLHNADSDTFTIGPKASAEVLRAARTKTTENVKPAPEPPPAPTPAALIAAAGKSTAEAVAGARNLGARLSPAPLKPAIVDEQHDHTPEQIAQVLDVPLEVISVGPAIGTPADGVQPLDDSAPVATVQDLPALLQRAQAITDDAHVATALDDLYTATGALAKALHQHDKRQGLQARAEALQRELAEIARQLGWPAPVIGEPPARDPRTAPTSAEIRAWAKDQGLPLPPRGPVPTTLRAAYLEAHA